MNKIVFTNGCFDILHSGHVELLEKARKMGDKLIVGINSDESVRSIKGKDRPVNSEKERAEVLRGLRSVDDVRIFTELTPDQLIKELKPDVLVKGGDWDESEIVGAEFVKNNGGEVFTIPLKEGLSTTRVIESLKPNGVNDRNAPDDGDSSSSFIEKALSEHFEVFEKLSAGNQNDIRSGAKLLLEALDNGKKVLICGNGGSAADSQHFAAELVGRYEKERKPLAAIALTTDTSLLTALSNDYSFERVFERQVLGLANEGDVLVAISTSGESPNVVKGIMAARNSGCKVVGLTSEMGRKMAALCDACVSVPTRRTSRIQEAHLAIIHIWCEFIDRGSVSADS